MMQAGGITATGDGRQVLSLPVTDIAIGDRIGFYDAAHAAQIGASIAAEGQHDPIHVRRNGNAAKQRWTLVAGLHRLRGTMLFGGEHVAAIQVADASAGADDLRWLELSENFDHRQRRPIERAIMIAERARLEEARDHPGHVGEARADRAARLRWDACATVAQASNDDARITVIQASEPALEDWLARTGAAASCSIRTLKRYRRIHREIVLALPDLAEPLNFHQLGESLSAMMRLAQIKTVIGRRKAAETILSDPELSSIDAAMVRAEMSTSKGAREAIAQNRLAASFRNNWKGLDMDRKRSAFVIQLGLSCPTILNFMRDEIDAALRERGGVA